MGASIIDDARLSSGRSLSPFSVPVDSVVSSRCAVSVIRDFLRSIYAKHAPAFVQVTQALSEPLRVTLTKHLQSN